MRLLRQIGALVAGFATLAACAQDDGGFPAGPLEARVVEVYPHDPNAFTQGLVVDDGVFYESTGRYGQSSLRRVAIDTGQVERLAQISSAFFAEGLTLLDDRLYQLTWQNGVAFVYDVDTFDSVGSFSYEGEGWGLTHDGERLILSDGTPTLRYLDPESFEVVGTIEVRDGDRPVNNLNELEFIEGEIWANVWYDDRIVRIDPADGAVLGWIDLSRIFPRSRRGSEDVLNGIAYDADSGRTFVTGKNWPVLFEIELQQLDDTQR